MPYPLENKGNPGEKLYNSQMKKKRIITIAGRPGSGKSTASKAVAKQLGYKHYSTGDFFREIGHQRGMDVHQTNVHAEGVEFDEKHIDYLVDQRQRELGENQDEFVIDARIAWHWMPYSFKVFLNLDLKVAAERILKNIDPDRLKHEHIPEEPELYAKHLQNRLASETKRYKERYKIDPYDMSHYDLIIDTSETTPDEVVEKILDAYNTWLAR